MTRLIDGFSKHRFGRRTSK